MSCKFCHNPETINFCCHCLECVDTCPTQALSVVEGKVIYNRSLCVDCDTCLKTCKHLSSPKTIRYSVSDLWKIVEEYRIFIRGITVSGGECMVHADFLLELFKKATENGLSCLIDSNGFFDFRQFPELLELAEGVMLDVKMWDEAKHLEITGRSNSMVLQNLKYLSECNKLSEVRMIMYPGFEEYNKETISNVLSVIGNDRQVKLIAYRPYGVRKEGIDFFGSEALSKKELELYCEYAKSIGAKRIICT